MECIRKYRWLAQIMPHRFHLRLCNEKYKHMDFVFEIYYLNYFMKMY